MGDRARERLADAPAVLVVDLVDEDLDGAALVESLARRACWGRRARWASIRTWTRLRASEPSKQASIWWFPVRAWPARARRWSQVWPRTLSWAWIASSPPTIRALPAAAGSSGTSRAVPHALVARRHAPADALEERDADHSAVTDDQRGQRARFDIAERRGDANALLGEGLSAGKGEVWLAARRTPQRRPVLRPAHRRRSGQSSRRRRSPSAAGPRAAPGRSAPRRYPRFRERAAAGCTTASRMGSRPHPPAAARSASSAACSRPVSSSGYRQLALEAALEVVGGLAVAGQVDASRRKASTAEDQACRRLSRQRCCGLVRLSSPRRRPGGLEHACLGRAGRLGCEVDADTGTRRAAPRPLRPRRGRRTRPSHWPSGRRRAAARRRARGSSRPRERAHRRARRSRSSGRSRDPATALNGPRVSTAAAKDDEHEEERPDRLEQKPGAAFTP